MLDLSIIIVSWNAKEYLLECLRSLQQETNGRRTEIIVVDNASSDGSPEFVQKEFPDVKLVRNDSNMGFAKANNIGVERSAGRYITFVNSDVKVLPGCIDSMYNYMEQNPAIGILGPKILNPDMTLQFSCREFPNLRNLLRRALGLDTIFPKKRYSYRDLACAVDVLIGCFWIVRRTALSQVGLLDSNFFIYSEDVDWCKRFWRAGWKVVYFPDAKAVHYGSASSSQAPVKFYVEMHRAKFYYWKKHHGRTAQFGFLLISLLHQTIRILRGVVLYLFRPSSKREMKLKIKRSIACMGWLLHVSGKSLTSAKETH